MHTTLSQCVTVQDFGSKLFTKSWIYVPGERMPLFTPLGLYTLRATANHTIRIYYMLRPSDCCECSRKKERNRQRTQNLSIHSLSQSFLTWFQYTSIPRRSELWSTVPIDSIPQPSIWPTKSKWVVRINGCFSGKKWIEPELQGTIPSCRS